MPTLFAALASLDSNGDGVIDIQDQAFNDIQVWVDANHDGISQSSELNSLLHHGIASIDLNAQAVDVQIDGQQIFAEGQFTLSSGETRDYVGVTLDVDAITTSPIVAKREVDASLSGNQVRVRISGGGLCG